MRIACGDVRLAPVLVRYTPVLDDAVEGPLVTQSRHFRRISFLACQHSVGDPMESLFRGFQVATLFLSRMLPAWAGNCRTGFANSWRGCFQVELSCEPKGTLYLLSEIGTRGRLWLQRR